MKTMLITNGFFFTKFHDSLRPQTHARQQKRKTKSDHVKEDKRVEGKEKHCLNLKFYIINFGGKKCLSRVRFSLSNQAFVTDCDYYQ